MAEANDGIVERILKAKRNFERIRGYKPERILIHYEGWHDVLRNKDSEYFVRVGLESNMQIMGMSVIRTADIRKTEFIVF